MKPYTLSPEQRQIVRSLARAAGPDGSGRYFICGGAYTNADEAEAALAAHCIAERKPPLSVIHDHERMLERDSKHDIIESEYLDRYRLPEKPEPPEQLERIKEMAKRIAWKDDDSGPS